MSMISKRRMAFLFALLLVFSLALFAMDATSAAPLGKVSPITTTARFFATTTRTT